MSNFNPELFNNQSILVTGATGGIGQAIVDELVNCGATVLANGRDKTALDKLEASYPNKVIPLLYDVTDEKQVSDAFRIIQKKQKAEEIAQFTGLVNNAGIMHESSLMTTSLETLSALFDTNLISAYQHMQLASRLMSRNKCGAIVNIVSQVGEQGSIGMSAYASSKAALTGVTKSVAKELATVGIRVNAVAPGFIDTKLTSHFDGDERAEVLSRCHLKRAGRATEVAQAVVFLLSQASSYTTGQVLAVDGLFQV